MAAVSSSQMVLRIPARPTSTGASESGLAMCVLRPARSHPLTSACGRNPENAMPLAWTAHSIGRNRPTLRDSPPRPNLHAQQHFRPDMSYGSSRHPVTGSPLLPPSDSPQASKYLGTLNLGADAAPLALEHGLTAATRFRLDVTFTIEPC